MKDEEVETLLGVWPKSVEVADLINEKIESYEKWDKPEAYFIKIADKPTIFNRLNLRHLTRSFNSQFGRTEKYRLQLSNIYTIITTDKVFMDLLGMILSIGNVLNGGTKHGQADGFDLLSLTRIHKF